MADLRADIEESFGRWAHRVARHPWLWIAACLLLAAGLATRLPLLETETSTEDYLFDSDPAKIAYDAFREQFGRDQVALVLLEPESGVFDLEFLERLEALHEDLEDSVVHLSDLTSLVNVRAVEGRGDELLVDDLMEDRPVDAASLARFRERVLSTESYLDSVVTPDGRIAILAVESEPYTAQDVGDEIFGGFDEAAHGAAEVAREPLSGSEIAAFARSLKTVLDRHQHPGIQVHLAGQNLITFALTESMQADLPRIFGAALGLIALLLILLFRRITPMVLASAVVLLSLVSTFGLAQLLGIALSLPTQVLPTFLLAVGVGYGVHLMTIYFRDLAGEGASARVAALESALRHSGLPILMTAVTTAAGLGSFLVAEMRQVAQLGLLGAAGVVFTLLFSLVLLPAMLLVWPERPGKLARGGGAAERLAGSNAFLDACARISVRHPWKLVVATTLLAVVSLATLPQLRIAANPVLYFPHDHWLRTGIEFADQRAGGMQTLEIVFDTGRENGLHEPEMLRRLEALRELVATLDAEGERVGRTHSLLEVVKETHQALNENRSDHYAIPEDRRLVAQELLLFENSGSDDLEKLVDPGFRKARFQIRVDWEGGVQKQKFMERVAPRVREAVGPDVDVELTGAVALISRTATATGESLVRSYTLALVLITPLMMLLIGSLRAGLVSMVPNLVPIVATVALIAGLGFGFDVFLMLGGCIAIGLAVDDSVHFIAGFRRHLAETGDPVRAVERTMDTTGRALLFTTVVLMAGFATLGLASMANLAQLGLFTAFAIGLAFLLDVTVTPALLVLSHRKAGVPTGSLEASSESWAKGSTGS